jgi:amphi-Trp domain-containing protein
VSDLKVEQKQTLSREEVARLITSLADGLGAGGKVTVPMGSSTLELSVAGQVDYELEVAVDGDEIELELELKWSTSGRAPASSAEEESEDDEGAEDEAAEEEAPEDEAAGDQAAGDQAAGDQAAGDEALEDEALEDEADEVEADEDEGDEDDDGEDDEGEAEHIELEAEPERHESDEEAPRPDVSAVGKARDRRVPADRTPRPRRGRRSASAATTQSTSNGVDTAAVRAWAAANGLSVSPRGRIKDEVLQAYRDAGN